MAKPPIQRSHSRPPLAGVRHFFAPPPLDEPELSIRGLGLRELMPACLIERPQGTPDFLVALFHDPALMGERPSSILEQPDTMMVWPPRKAQYYGRADAPFCHTWIHGQGRRFVRILRQARIPLLRPFRPVRPGLFLQCLEDIHGELVTFTHPDPVIVGNLLENFLRGSVRTPALPGRGVRIPENLLAVRRLIGTAPARAIPLAEMAALAGMSVSHFCARFKQYFGLPPMECLIHQRMSHAAHLLGDPNRTVAEIAVTVGYDDAFHFSKMFKKHFGVSPSDHRSRQ